MTNYADYPTTERFWQLVEELRLEKPRWVDRYWVQYPTDIPSLGNGLDPNAKTLFRVLDSNLLLSWEWLTKPRHSEDFSEYYTFELHYDIDGDRSCCHRSNVNHGDYRNYYHGWTFEETNIAECLARYAISLMEYERGEK